MNMTELATLRRKIIEGGNNWHDYDEKRSKKEFRKLLNVEAAIVKLPITSELDKAAAAEILLEANDGPDFADNFKTKLFGRFKKRA